MNSENRRSLRLLRFSVPGLLVVALLAIDGGRSIAQEYYPPPGEWERRSAADLGMNAEKLAAAVELAKAGTVVEPKDMTQMITNSFGREPHFSIIGPVKAREAGSGLVIRGGYVVAEWGDIERADMTFSVTKSYLSTLAGLALDEGLIVSIHDPVKKYVAHESFEQAHNAPITWDNFLTQTSDWQGTLFGKPDWADRPVSADPEEAMRRKLNQPGSFYKYNDVRVNMLSLLLLHVWQRQLDEVLRERIMDPIGASNEWQWHGYDNSWVDIKGRKLHSLSGGAHWGGGFFISTLDHARYGYLFLRNGKWDGKQLISENWLQRIVMPSKANKDYGYLWWLNTDQGAVANAPASAFYASGAGGNYIWIDRENDLLIVLRWVPRMNSVISAFTDAIES